MRLRHTDTCCCVFPLYNVGIYTIILEQAALAIVVAVLALATPQILAASVPSFAADILAAISVIYALIQLLGFYAVRTDSSRLLRTYIPASAIFLALSLIVSLVWIILSATKRSEGISRCLSDFGNDASDTSGEGICSTFISIQLGIMGLLLLIALIVQSYFALMTRIYASNLARDHQKYRSILSLKNNNPTSSPALSPSADTPSNSSPLVGHDISNTQEKSTDHLNAASSAPSLYPDPYPSEINLYHPTPQPHHQPYIDDPIYYSEHQDPYYYAPDHLVQQQPEQHTYYPYEYNQGYYSNR